MSALRRIEHHFRNIVLFQVPDQTPHEPYIFQGFPGWFYEISLAYQLVPMRVAVIQLPVGNKDNSGIHRLQRL